MAKFNVGEHVWADFGEGKVLAHVETTDEDGDGKHTIQNPGTGKGEPLAYREPEDDDAAGSGRTFWKV